jgi:2-polyprenyl-3-methyl-5-hydroxy-6-metoxy-1,4-benzoquinol methylase
MPATTAEPEYARRLQRLARRGGALRRIADPQRPYRWNLRRLRPGRVLDLGCGIGRNLGHLDGNGVGIDHNPTAVELCRRAGWTAYTPEEFTASDAAQDASFDSLLVAHVLEHMTIDDAVRLVGDHLRFVRPGGRVIVITPQARGQRSDPTHVTMIGPAQIEQLAARLGLAVASVRSFPFPRWAGGVFTYNENVGVLAKAA